MYVCVTHLIINVLTSGADWEYVTLIEIVYNNSVIVLYGFTTCGGLFLNDSPIISYLTEVLFS